MTRRPIIISAILFLSIYIFLCSCKTQVTSNTSQPETSPIAKSAPNLTAEEIIKSLKAANLPIKQEIIFTAENDPNKLLGRPNQYIGKASWNDKRYKSLTPDSRAYTIEVFDSNENLENRRKYIEAITKSASVFVEYAFVHKNSLLRLSKELTPQQAAEYEKIFKAL